MMKPALGMKFTSLSDLRGCISSYLDGLGLPFVEVPDVKDFIMVCPRKKEFGCNAQIHAAYKKRDGIYILRKLKINHKCPPIDQQVSTADYLKEEIYAINRHKQLRIGEIVTLLSRKNLKFSYNQIFQVISGRSVDEEVMSGESLSPTYVEAMEAWAKEFVSLNPDVECKFSNTGICIVFPWVLSQCRPVVELKRLESQGPSVILAVCYDPLDFPVVVSLMADTRPLDAILPEFLEAIEPEKITEKNFNDAKIENLLKTVTYVVECDSELISGLSTRNYHLKTRSLCKNFCDGKKEKVENLWNYCNLDVDYEVDVPKMLRTIGIQEVQRSAYRPANLFNIQNFSEIDLDVAYHTYPAEIIDSVNVMTKLISDEIRISVNESGWGENVDWRIKKNIEKAKKMELEKSENATQRIVLDEKEKFAVDLSNLHCSCGLFQMLLIPCPHACKVLGDSAYDYVDDIYSLKRLEKIHRKIVPVINEPVKILDRTMLKRGPGRPKKAK